MVKRIEIAANTTKDVAEAILSREVRKLKDFGVTFSDGDIIELHQFCYTSHHFVMHNNQWRYFGEY